MKICTISGFTFYNFLWLIESYKNVILVDPRIFDGDFQTVLDKYSPDEVLVVNYIFTTVFTDYCNLLKNLYN